MTTWPAQLRTARESAGVSIHEMARRLAVTRQTVMGYERAGANLSESTVRRYCEAIGVDARLVLQRKESA